MYKLYGATKHLSLICSATLTAPERIEKSELRKAHLINKWNDAHYQYHR